MSKKHKSRGFSLGEYSIVKNLLLLLALLHASATFAQVKLSLAKMHINYRHSPHRHIIRNFAPAIVLKGQRNFCHEVELAALQKFKADDRRYFLFGLRYQFTKNLIRKPDPRIMPQVGLSMTQWYTSDKLYYEAWGYRERFDRSFSFIVGFAPQVRMHVWRKWYADLAMPVTVMGFGHGRTKLSKPTTPIADQSYSYNNHAFFNPIKERTNVNLRLGIGVKL
jgi:hypothetical protein